MWACEEDTWYPTMSVPVPVGHAVHAGLLAFLEKKKKKARKYEPAHTHTSEVKFIFIVQYHI